jgi:hypothetical protein
VIRVEDSAAHANAHAWPKELDPVALTRNVLIPVLFVSHCWPHEENIGSRPCALERATAYRGVVRMC